MTKEKHSWWLDLNRLGILGDSDDEINRRIAFSNAIFISLPIVYILFMIIDYDSFFKPISTLRFDQFIVPIEILICLFCLWLNMKKYAVISRLLFIITWPFFLHIIPIWLLQTPGDYYLAFPFGMVFHALLIQLMFSHRKEPVYFWTFLTLNFITILFIPNILAFFVSSETGPNEIVFDKYFLFDGILYWLLFNLVMYYILMVIEAYIKKENNSKAVIHRQKEALDLLNQDLERKVLDRTRQLEEQNKKLKEYAYYNAHLLRGPFCRIQGLVHLMKVDEHLKETTSEIIERLGNSINELDIVIKKIKHIVETEGEVV